jgi:hypothetical protein
MAWTPLSLGGFEDHQPMPSRSTHKKRPTPRSAKIHAVPSCTRTSDASLSRARFSRACVRGGCRVVVHLTPAGPGECTGPCMYVRTGVHSIDSNMFILDL